VDADIIPAPDLYDKARACVDHVENDIGVITFMVQDKLLFGNRYMAIRIYRAAAIPDMLALMPPLGGGVRPESSTITRLVERGWRHKLVPEVLALHDYEQFYRDIYRKAYLHMQKHGARMARLLELWMRLADHDSDYQAALAGATDAMLERRPADCDASHAAFQNKDSLSRIGLEEKSALDGSSVDYQGEIERLQEALDRGEIAPVSPTEQEAFDQAQPERDALYRVERIGANLRSWAESSCRLQAAVAHQTRRALPDQVILDTFSTAELARYAVGRIRRAFQQ
jgi:hypothetical protein